MIGEPHEPDHLAVAFGRRHPEVAKDFLFGVAALVLRDGHHAAAFELRETADDRVVVAEMAVAVQLVELVERGDVLRAERTLRMTGHVHALPRRHRAEHLALDLRVLVFEAADLGRHVDRLLRSLRFELRDALLELQQTLLALDDDVHGLATRPLSGRRAPTP